MTEIKVETKIEKRTRKIGRDKECDTGRYRDRNGDLGRERELGRARMGMMFR